MLLREAFTAAVLELGKMTAFRDFVGEPLGTKPLVDRNPSRVRPENSEVQRLLSPKTQIRALLNWRGQISLNQGLCSTIAWFETHMHLCHHAREEYVV